MVRRRLTTGTLLLGAIALGCEKERDMAETLEMPDTMDIMRAMDDPAARDVLLDTMPGGELARGDSAAEMKLLKTKM